MKKSLGENLIKEINNIMVSFVNNKNSLSTEELEFVERSMMLYLKYIQETLNERKKNDILSKELRLVSAIEVNMKSLLSSTADNSIKNEDGSFNISKIKNHLDISRYIIACIDEYELISSRNKNFFKHEKEDLNKYVVYMEDILHNTKSSNSLEDLIVLFYR